ncbi:hypothetical protein [Thermoanaerobacterium sp. RBIITD]|uniref:hypothetical protein n=1 Tax=Thermoanaerobacterium sp. RBIITD TaxID=1550240 RepID=UPI000BB811BA|nr:hypothetical protein [Thermoanaerobacterium sp. RBIITD]SNX54993.1 hypothetical protein SAMN05660242_2766 [Thermoanaerobacterium sp. RBIITD]
MIPSIFLNKYELIEQELKGDIYYDKIKEMDIRNMAEMAWNRGIDEAKKYKKHEIIELTKNEGIKIEVDKIHYTPGYIIFSQITSNEKKITIYMKNIENKFIPSIPDKYSLWKDENKLLNLFICHEYYHCLEYYHIGFTSDIYKVNIKFGFFILKKGLNSLNEIAAHAFVKEFYDIW